jgi:hypothetical protein
MLDGRSALCQYGLPLNSRLIPRRCRRSLNRCSRFLRHRNRNTCRRRGRRSEWPWTRNPISPKWRSGSKPRCVVQSNRSNQGRSRLGWPIPEPAHLITARKSASSGCGHGAGNRKAPALLRPPCLPGASSTASNGSAHLRPHFPSHSIPHSGVPATSPHYPPRVRSLAAFGRRPPWRLRGCRWPASETLHTKSPPALQKE